MSDFKYPLLQTFFDCDGVSCIFVDELVKLYPKIDHLSIDYKLANNTYQHSRDFESFGWGLCDRVVMASNDAEQFMNLYNKILVRCYEEKSSIEDVEFRDIGVCNVCDELLFPDDELYSDEDTHVALCDSHSAYNEDSNNYFSFNDERLFIEGIKLHNLDNLKLEYVELENELIIYRKTYEVGKVEKGYTKDGLPYIKVNKNNVYIKDLSSCNVFQYN